MGVTNEYKLAHSEYHDVFVSPLQDDTAGDRSKAVTLQIICRPLDLHIHTNYTHYLYCCKKNVKITTERKFWPQTGINNADCNRTPKPKPIIISIVFNPPYNGDNALWNDIHATSINRSVKWVAVRKFSYSTFFFFPWYNSTYALMATIAIELANPTLKKSCLISGLWIILWNKLMSALQENIEVPVNH